VLGHVKDRKLGNLDLLGHGAWSSMVAANACVTDPHPAQGKAFPARPARLIHTVRSAYVFTPTESRRRDVESL